MLESFMSIDTVETTIEHCYTDTRTVDTHIGKLVALHTEQLVGVFRYFGFSRRKHLFPRCELEIVPDSNNFLYERQLLYGSYLVGSGCDGDSVEPT